MATGLIDIANNAGYRLGGFGDQNNGNGEVTAVQLTADDDRISNAINTKYPVVRKRVIKQFAAMKTPFNETVKYADLGDDLIQDDVVIESLVNVEGIVTFTTAEAHGLSIADTRFLSDLQGTLVVALNGNTYTVATVPSTTTFTLTGVEGTASWDYTDSTGKISKAPEVSGYMYAFELPSDYFAMVRQKDEVIRVNTRVHREYQHRVITNIDSDGFLLLTNDLTNLGGDSAYIEYVIDQETYALFSDEFEDTIAQLLAAELAPVMGRNTEFRQGLLTEYHQLTVPEAKRAIQSQSNNYSKVVNDFSGGRSSGSAVPRIASNLGTYTDASGNRRSI